MSKTIQFAPQAGALGKICLQLPNTNDTDLDFSRNSQATVRNKDGILDTNWSANLPRYNFEAGDPCPSLLVEPQSTNLVTYSEDFSNESWIKRQSTLVLNSSISPSGTNNMTKIIINNGVDASSAGAGVRKSLTISSATTYTYSYYVKKAEWNGINLLASTSSGSCTGQFDIENGVVTNTISNGDFTNVLAKIINFGEDIYRVSLTFTSGVDTSLVIFLWGFNDNPLNDVGDGTSGLYIWGAQLEEQSYSTSYIPTSGATATRVAETVSKTGLENYINSSEGVLYLNSKALFNNGTFRNISLSDGTSNNRVLFYYSSNTNQIGYSVEVGGVSQAGGVFTVTDITDFNHYAIKWKENDFALWVNGVEVLTDVSGSVFPTNTLNRLGFDNSSAGNFLGALKDLRVYNQILKDSELSLLKS
tara:strand:- start:25500 stop:26753 length:1254 start_codon:yes stop_codon:yes gene_type:complete